MYDSQTALIANYINPIIGDMEVQDITTRVVDKYIQTLQKTPSVSRIKMILDFDIPLETEE